MLHVMLTLISLYYISFAIFSHCDKTAVRNDAFIFFRLKKPDFQVVQLRIQSRKNYPTATNSVGRAQNKFAFMLKIETKLPYFAL